MAGEELFKTFSKEAHKDRCYLYFPYIENFSFSKDYTYKHFFENCNDNGINYDIGKKLGTVFVPYDSITTGILGMIVIDEDYNNVIRHAARTFSYLSNMVDINFEKDSSKRYSLVTIDKCTEKLNKLHREIHNGHTQTNHLAKK